MLQEITIVGHLGRDPEMRYTPSGKAVTNFHVAVKDKVFKDGETQDATIWFRVTTWGAQAEACQQYLSKGDLALVKGKLTFDIETGGPRIWGEDEPRATFEINAEMVKFLHTKNKEERESPYDEEKKSKPKPKASGKKSSKAPWEE